MGRAYRSNVKVVELSERDLMSGKELIYRLPREYHEMGLPDVVLSTGEKKVLKLCE